MPDRQVRGKDQARSHESRCTGYRDLRVTEIAAPTASVLPLFALCSVTTSGL